MQKKHERNACNSSAIRGFECPKKYRHLWKYVAYAKRKICILHELRTVIWTAIYAERIVFDVKLV